MVFLLTTLKIFYVLDLDVQLLPGATPTNSDARKMQMPRR